MMDPQENKGIKAILGCWGEEETQEDPDHLDFTEESLVKMGGQGFLDPQALQASLGPEGSSVFQDFQVTRVSQVFQGALDLPGWME